MQKENATTSHTDVIPAIAQFVREAYYQEEIQDLPNDFQDIFEMFLESNYADDQATRLKLLECQRTIRAFAKCFEPFTKEQVEQACKEHCHV